MKTPKRVTLLSLLLLLTTGLIAFTTSDDQLVTYTVDLKKQDLQLYWKDDKGTTIGSIQNLKNFVESKKQTLLFAMNGGMYKTDNSPLGLFIQNQQILAPLNNSTGHGNFYLQPNGVFYITTDNRPVICTTADFKASISNNFHGINYATQSGPMLVINGQIHQAFKEGSTNLNIRNGVGILPDNRLIFAMSKKEINFYDFAKYFQNLGCKNALYLDGFVSRAYLPEKQWLQTDGNFGVIIGVTQK